MTDTTIVDIYCRVALDRQGYGVSLDEQEAACRQYCLENGLTICAVYRDIFSGYQYCDRPGLEVMRRRYLQGEIQSVIVYCPDRLLNE